MLGEDNCFQHVFCSRGLIENDIMEVGRASQRAVQAEIENFKRHRLPAISSLLSPLNIAHSAKELTQFQLGGKPWTGTATTKIRTSCTRSSYYAACVRTKWYQYLSTVPVPRFSMAALLEMHGRCSPHKSLPSWVGSCSQSQKAQIERPFRFRF